MGSIVANLRGAALATCACGACKRCKDRKRKRRSKGIVMPHWSLWSEAYRYLHFRSINRELGGPNANLQSPLDRWA